MCNVSGQREGEVEARNGEEESDLWPAVRWLQSKDTLAEEIAKTRQWFLSKKTFTIYSILLQLCQAVGVYSGCLVR